VGKRCYFLQGSGADFRAGRLHSRSYFWLKDIMCPATAASPQPDDVLGIVDVDYYVDMPRLLTQYFQPYLIYTFVPSRAARARGEYKYCFLEDGSVEYRVSGGGSYRHKLWNWDGDSLKAVSYWYGIPWTYRGYAIERRQMDDDHQLILLAPLAGTNNPLTTAMALWKLDASTLKRFNPIYKNFVRFYVNTKEALMVATGKPRSYSDSFVPADVDDSIRSTMKVVSGKLTLASVKSKMDDGCPTEIENHRGAEVLLEFHLADVQQRNVETVSLVDTVRRFQYVPKNAVPDPEAKPGMVAFMRPILDGGFVPDICRGNEDRFVEERVKKIKTEEMPLDMFTLNCMRDFIRKLIPTPHRVFPTDIETVYERQSKPSQRAILAAADNGQSNSVTKQFMKREAYGQVTDPRGISQINGVDKRDYSRYIYAFADHVLKPQAWYAFGRTPREIAERVTEICSDADYVDLTDFSRMDGRVSNIARELERLAMFRAFGPDYHVELYELMRKQCFLTAVTVFKIRYKTENQRLSGSPETSAFNTLLTAFIMYMAFRRMKTPLGRYYTSEEAWNNLGIYGGDDGLTAGLDRGIAKASAAGVGQKLDLERVPRGKLGVSFLARRYGPDVWYGDSNSCCDLKRQLTKFHLTVNLPQNIPPWKRLQEKAFSFALTDRNSPVMGEFVRKVLELYPLKPEEFKNELGIWGVEMDADRQYPNESAEWMEDIVNTELANFDLDHFRSWLRSSDSESIFHPPRLAEPIPPNPKPGVVAIDGDLNVVRHVGDDGGRATSPPAKSNGKTAFRPRKPKAERPSHQVKK
jgi:hypothetical protein